LSELFTTEEIEKTRELLELFQENNLSQLSISEPDGFAIEIIATSIHPVSTSSQVAPASPVGQHITHQPAPMTASSSLAPAHKTLNAPMVGIFYTSPSPGDPPYVSAGDTVSIGQTIGLIEAMKVFSEIPAEVSGKIVELVAATGTLVQQNQPLYSIEPI
jgi:acetyl-CoA carboxylase biotin carboxyl carrier protein